MSDDEAPPPPEDEPSANEVCPECHARLAQGESHSTNCVLDFGEVTDSRPIGEERAVLGRMMLDHGATGLVASMLRAEHFTKVSHRDLFESIVELWERGDPIDPVSVAASLTGNKLVRVGGALYVHALIRDVPTVTDVVYHCELIRDRFRREEVVNVLQRAIGITGEGDARQTAANLEAVREMVESVTADHDAGEDEDGVWLHDAIDDEVEAWNEPESPGIMSGFADFDDVVGGFRPGQLILVAARPGIGKSVLSTDWGRHAAEHDRSVLLFSLEMPRRDVMQRLVAAKAKVRLADIRHRTTTDYERSLMKQAAASLKQLKFRIEDGHSVSMTRLRTVARSMKRSATGLDLMIVDYLQLITPADQKTDRRIQVDQFSRGLKSLAKELDVPVVALAQLNRGPESRTDKKPMLSDLRESGGLEQDADLVVLINRPDAFEREDPRAGEADLILAKHRNGPTATIPVAHQLHYARFGDLYRGPAEVAA